jgi:hypothetical protein
MTAAPIYRAWRIFISILATTRRWSGTPPSFAGSPALTGAAGDRRGRLPGGQGRNGGVAAAAAIIPLEGAESGLIGSGIVVWMVERTGMADAKPERQPMDLH